MNRLSPVLRAVAVIFVTGPALPRDSAGARRQTA